jgi:nicotinamidase-related amidase
LVGVKLTFVAKQQYSCFFGSTLDNTLRAAEIKTVYLVGINTNICVFKTAIDGWERSYVGHIW